MQMEIVFRFFIGVYINGSYCDDLNRISWSPPLAACVPLGCRSLRDLNRISWSPPLPPVCRSLVAYLQHAYRDDVNEMS